MDDHLLVYARRVLGPLPAGWEMVRVGDLLERGVLSEVQDGNHGEIHPKSTDYVTEGVPFVMARDLADGRLDLHNCAFLRREHAESLRTGFSRPGDVLLTHKATLGRVAIVPDGIDYVMLTPQVTYYRVGDCQRLERSYLRYAFLGPSFRHQLNADSDQSTRKFISITAQRRLWLALPPISEQRGIARTLGALDEKIELNRRMNETLEEMARAFFKSWFVDFNPVRAKAERRVPAAMDAATAALFPDGFEESEIGAVPRGWRVVGVPEAIEVNPVCSLKKGEVAPYLDMKNMPTSGHLAHEWEPRPYGSGARFMNGDTLLARITPCLENGKTAFVDFIEPGQVGWGSTEYIVLRPKPPLPEYFAYLLARSDGLRAHAIQSMTGTTGRQRVPVSALDHYRVAIPPAEVAVAFDLVTKDLIKLSRTNDQESRTLRDLRDVLLSKLLSGELRVRDAERVVERAV